MPIWHDWGGIHAMPSTAGGQIISAVSQGHVIAARLVIDVWLRLWDQSVVSQGEERGRLFRGLNDKRGPTSQRKAEGTMPECNNQIEIGRRDTFLPSWTHRGNHCSNGLMMQCNEEWWFHSLHIIYVTGISVSLYAIEYINQPVLKLVHAQMFWCVRSWACCSHRWTSSEVFCA